MNVRAGRYLTTRQEESFLVALNRMYPKRDHLVLKQVAVPLSDTTFRRKRRRTIDALVVGFWKSRGVIIHGFEMKASRADWLNELEHPEKAEEAAFFCDNWSILAFPDVVREEELPKNWGLYVLDQDSIDLKRHPAALEPHDLTRDIFCSLVTSIIHQAKVRTPEKELAESFQAGVASGVDQGKQVFRIAVEEVQKSLLALQRENDFLRETIESLDIGRNHTQRDENLRVLSEVMGALRDRFRHQLIPHAAGIIDLMTAPRLSEMRNELFGMKATAETLLQAMTSSLSALNALTAPVESKEPPSEIK